MKAGWLLLPLLGGALSLQAAEMKVGVEIPQLDVAEYHRPYVSVWIEREDSSVAANLAVWYQQERGQKREPGGKAEANGPATESGTKWLPDLRQWWRRSGRSASLPIDGVTGATRPVGTHELVFESGKGPIATLGAGSYRLVVEAAREVGGRELQKIAFQWPPAEAQQLSVQGTAELGRISLALTP